MNPSERNEVVTLVEMARDAISAQHGDEHAMYMIRTDFDVFYKSGSAELTALSPWQMERQVSFQIYGDGLGCMGMDERRARARWARSMVTFEAVQS